MPPIQKKPLPENRLRELGVGVLYLFGSQAEGFVGKTSHHAAHMAKLQQLATIPLEDFAKEENLYFDVAKARLREATVCP